MIQGLYKTRAIIIRKRVFGEADKILTMLTDDGRRVEALARGSRKCSHKYAGLLEPMVLAELVLSKGRIFDIVKEAKLISDGRVLEQGLKGLGLNCLLGEVLDKISRDNENDFFKLIVDYLNCYQNHKMVLAEKNKMYLFASSFLLSVLAVSGRLPLLDICWRCGRNDWVGQIYLTAYGLTHRDCLQGDMTKEIDLVEKEWLAEVLKNSAGNLLYKEIGPDQAVKMFDNCYFLFKEFFDKDICSLDFLREVYTNK